MSTGVTPKSRKSGNNPVFITYEGKKEESEILALGYPDFVKAIEVNGGDDNAFFWCDNRDALLYLLNNGYGGKINLIYIDPPFATASDYLSRDQTHAYSDTLCGGDFVEFLRERLIIMRELLAKSGSIYLHLDDTMAFQMKLVMDEVFGAKNCRAFITRKKCSTKNFTKKTFGNISDYVMFYTKSDDYTWNRPFAPWDHDNMIEQYPCVDEKTGRRYKKVPIHAPGVRNGETGKAWRGKMPPKGKHWQYRPDKLDELDAAGEIYWSATGNPRRMVFCDPDKGVPVQDIWLDYRDAVNQAQKTTGYPTEKNFDMMKMIVAASSNPGDIVLDCFAGSGTTLGAAFELGRRWIGADCEPESVKAVVKRFTTGLDMFGDYVSEKSSVAKRSESAEKCPFAIYATKDNEEELLSMISGH